MDTKSKPLPRLYRAIFGFVAIVGLLCLYLFQRFNFFEFFTIVLGVQKNYHPYVAFVVNRTLRLILNDLACCLLIVALFQSTKYLKLGIWVVLFELVVLLPFYFVVKLNLEGDSEISSPFLSQIHRLIVNPLLMGLLIMAIAYQRRIERPPSG